MLDDGELRLGTRSAVNMVTTIAGRGITGKRQRRTPLITKKRPFASLFAQRTSDSPDGLQSQGRSQTGGRSLVEQRQLHRLPGSHGA